MLTRHRGGVKKCRLIAAVPFFRTPDDRIVALEANLRPPGGLTMDIFNYANDADFYQAWADLLVRGQVALAYSRPYHCGFAGRKARKSYIHTHDEIMAAFGRLIVHHEPLSPLFSRVLGHVGYVVRSPEMSDIRDAVRFILATE